MRNMERGRLQKCKCQILIGVFLCAALIGLCRFGSLVSNSSSAYLSSGSGLTDTNSRGNRTFEPGPELLDMIGPAVRTGWLPTVDPGTALVAVSQAATLQLPSSLGVYRLRPPPSL